MSKYLSTVHTLQFTHYLMSKYLSTYFRIFFHGKKSPLVKVLLEKCMMGEMSKWFFSPCISNFFWHFSFFLVYTLCFFYMLWQWHGWNISHNQIITLATLLHCKPQPILASTFHHIEILSRFWKQSLQGIKYSLVSDGRISNIFNFLWPLDLKH